MTASLTEQPQGPFLQTDPVPGGSCNSYDYACQDPVNAYDLDGKWYQTLLHLQMTPTEVWALAGALFGEAIGTNSGAWAKIPYAGVVLQLAAAYFQQDVLRMVGDMEQYVIDNPHVTRIDVRIYVHNPRWYDPFTTHMYVQLNRVKGRRVR